MKPQKLRLSWCKFLLITTSDFDGEARIISSKYSRLNICQIFYFLKPCCNYVFPSLMLTYIKERKDECDFHMRVFCFYKFRLSILVSSSRTLMLNVIHSSKISIHYGGQTEVYLELSWTSMMEPFRKGALTYLFEWVLNKILAGICRKSERLKKNNRVIHFTLGTLGKIFL